MAGIYGVISLSQQNSLENISNHFHSASIDNSLNEDRSYQNFIYGRSVPSKFLDDRILAEDDSLIIAYEGVCFNKEGDSFDTLKKYYYEDSLLSIKKIKGQFSGFVYDKKINKLFIFNDHLNTKPLYFYRSSDLFIFASELKVVTKLLTKFDISKELNYDALYSMLTYGYLINNVTYEKNIEKLQYATILEVDSNLEMSQKKYFYYRKTINDSLSKNEIIEKIDTLLVKSVERCWLKDSEYSDKYYSFLSGGLDSRVNTFLAKELGFTNILGITFSQSNSSDEKIAKEICQNEKFEHFFYSLDNGVLLENNLQEYVSANDGLVTLNASASGYYLLSMLDSKKFGALHTGQIGDLLFGSYIKKNFKPHSGIMSNRVELLQKISFYDDYEQKYTNSAELFAYEERVIHGTLNGDRTTSHFTDMLSPFYDRELIEFCLSIPDRYKKDEAIYLDWFNQKHPKIAEYVWESAGIKPKNSSCVKVAKMTKRIKNALMRRMGLRVNDMNPFDVWLRSNPKILNNLDSLYQHYLHCAPDDIKDLLDDIYHDNVHFSHYGRNNKFLVVTLLLALDLHFGD